MITQSALLKVMSDAARKAARGLNRDFGELGELQVAKKAPADFVSAADTKSAGAFLATCSSASSPKSRLSPRAALRAASLITFRRADWVLTVSKDLGGKWPRKLVVGVA